jgi:ATP-dependent DNA helicase Q1
MEDVIDLIDDASDAEIEEEVQQNNENEENGKDEISLEIAALKAKVRSNSETIAKLNKENGNLQAQIEKLQSRQLEVMMQRGVVESEAFNSEPIQQATEVLRNVFKLSEWRSPQKEIINAVLSRRDVLVIMPAGSGKSLTYQLPAVLQTDGKVFFVVSPLLALMVDQIDHLGKFGVRSVMISSTTSKDEQKEIWNELLGSSSSASNSGPIRLVYVTPEFLARSRKMRSQLSKLNAMNKIGMFVIDEAHCCSQWGHDFRTDYRKLNLIRTLWRDVPIMALTATAPHSVRKDIVSLLQMRDPILFFKSVKRENLFYSVLEKKSPTDATSSIGKLIKAKYANACGLVYCLQRKETEEVAKVLQKDFGIKAIAFHADLSHQERDSRFRRWCDGRINVIVATVAFGMGIHKSDVRFVFHHTMSKSLSAYYQESGRAGRDGLPAECTLFYSPFDASRISALSCNEVNGIGHLRSMIRYAQAKKDCCRNRIIVEHFEETMWNSDSDGEAPASTCQSQCDLCTQDSELNEVDVTTACQAVLNMLESLANSDRKTMIQWEKELSGIDSTFKSLSKNQRGEVLMEMLLQFALDFEFVANAYAINAYILRGTALIHSPIKVYVKSKAKKKQTPRKRKAVSVSASEAEDDDEFEEIPVSKRQKRVAKIEDE